MPSKRPWWIAVPLAAFAMHFPNRCAAAPSFATGGQGTDLVAESTHSPAGVRKSIPIEERARSLVGTVRDRQTGSPCAGVNVSCSSSGGLEQFETLTDDVGQFRIAVPQSSGLTTLVLERGPLGEERTFELPEFERDLNLGTVLFGSRYWIRGCVRAGNGYPTPEVHVRVAGCSIETDSEGKFQLRGVPAGCWPIEFEAECGSLTVQEIEVPSNRCESGEWDIGSRAAEVRGVAFFDDGQPAEGCPLRFVDTATGTDLGFATVSNLGRISALLPYRPESIDLVSGDARFRVVAGNRLASGVDLAAVKVSRSRELAVQVLERDTGFPVQQFCVAAWSENASTDPVRSQAGSHPNGRALLDGVWPGTNYIWVEPQDSTLGSKGPIRVDIEGDTDLIVQVLLERSRKLQVRVVDERGMPIAGSKLVLARPVGGPRIEGDLLMWDPMSGMTPPAMLMGSMHVRSDSTESDPEGMAMLRFPKSEQHEMALLSQHEEYLASREVVKPANCRSDAVLEVRMQKAFRIAGTVAPIEAADRIDYVHLASASNPDLVWTAELLPGGAFHCRGLPVGDYSVVLESDGLVVGRLPRTVSIRGDHQGFLQIDASKAAPASVQGFLLIQGEVPRNVRSCARRVSKHGAFGNGDAVSPTSTRPEGWFYFQTLPPGEWIIEFEYSSYPGHFGFATAKVSIVPGIDIETVIDLTVSRVILECVAANGSPLEHPATLEASMDRERWASLVSDSKGRIVWETSRMETLWLRNEVRELGAFQLPPQGSQRVEVLPIPSVR